VAQTDIAYRDVRIHEADRDTTELSHDPIGHRHQYPFPEKGFLPEKTKMSLLISRDYANASKPLWLPSGGGTIDGNVTITGQLDVAGAMGSETSVYAPTFIALDLSGNIVGEISHQAVSEGDAGDGLVLSGDRITFGKVGTNQGNTTLVTSAYGSGLDSLTTNFLYAVGPVPSAPVPAGANPTVTLATGTPSRTASFGLTTPYPLLANAEYDVQATGFVSWSAGTAPSAGDLVSVAITVGSGVASSQAVTFYPGDAPFTWSLNVGVPFSLRARLTATGTPPANLTCSVTFSGASGTGTISGTLNLMDVVRVS